MALQVDDVELIKTFKAGDPDAFTHVVGQYRDVLFRHALRRLHDPSAAEDAVQETFFRAYRAFDRLRDDSRLGPWLHHILSNVCVDEAKRRQRVSVTSNRAGGDPTRTRLAEPDLEEQLGLHVDAGPVRRAMGGLPESHRAAFTMRFIDELDYDQIAAVSGTSEQNARARVSRARAAIRAAVRGAAVVPVFVLGWLRRGTRPVAALDKIERVDQVHRTSVAVEGATTMSKVATSIGPAVETASAVALHAQHSAPLMTKAAVGIGAIALAAMSTGPERPAPEPAPVLQAATPAPTTAPPTVAATPAPTPTPTTTAAAITPVVVPPRAVTEEPSETLIAEVAEVAEVSVVPTTVAATAPPATAAPTTVAPATTTPPTTTPPTTMPATTAPPTTVVPAPVGGTMSVSGLTTTPAGPRLDLSGPVSLAIGDVVHEGSLTGRVLIDGEPDGSGRQRLDGVVTVSGAFGTIEIRLAGHAVSNADAPAPTSFSWSGQFRATGADALTLVTAGSFTGTVAPGSLTLRLSP